MGNDKLDSQVSARLLKRALIIRGSRERLAESLGVHPEELARWIAGQAFPPQSIFEKVLEIVLDTHAKQPPSDGATLPPAARHRALVAERPAGCEVIAGILGEEFDLVAVHTLTEALDILQSSVVVKGAGIDVIICGQHFEGSQMLLFLECVKAYKTTSGIPFVGCRATPTQLGDHALAAMREACEALGAVAYIDLPERERHEGAEAAAVEFRDAVRAAVHLPRKSEPLRILVVDDNPDAAHTLSALLRMAGHDVHKAASGAEALQIAREQRPAVAVVDLAMPDISGYVLAQSLRAEPWGQAILLIALTGHGSAADAARSRAAGFDHHFTKPVTLERLLEVFPRAQPN